MPAYLLAARRPLALLVLLVAVLSGLFVALWLFPLGVIVYGVVVFLSARDPQLLVDANRPTRPRLTSTTFKTQLDAIERTQQEIERSTSQSGGALSTLLRPIADQAAELVSDAYVLADKGQIIETYLRTIDQKALQQRLRTLDQQVATTTDQYTRDQLLETRQAVLDKQTNARELQTFINRIQANLQNIAATLDNVLAESVRLRTADAASTDIAANQVAQRLNDIKSDMDAFQSVLDTAIAQTTTA